MGINLYSLKLVKEKTFRIRDCQSPDLASRIIREMCADKPNEHFVAVFIDGRNQMIGSHVIGQGGIHGISISPRDVFRAAIVANASGLVLGHNHPSGDPTPSQEDISTTLRLIDMGKALGINVVEHIVVSLDGEYSMSEHHLVLF